MIALNFEYLVLVAFTKLYAPNSIVKNFIENAFANFRTIRDSSN